MSDIVSISVLFDTSDEHAKLSEIKTKNDQIAREIEQNRQKTIRLQKMAVRVARSLMSLFRSLLTAFGVSVNAMGRALMRVVDNLIAMAGAWLMYQTARASAGDALAAFGLGTAALALGVSIGAAVRIAEGAEWAEREVAKIDGVLSSVESLARAPGRWGTF